jgi:hypothetical protein
MAAEIDVFVQAEGLEPDLVRLREGSTLVFLVEELRKRGRVIDETVVFFEEDGEVEILEVHREAFRLKHRHRIHHHRCRQIQVTVQFNGQTPSHIFRPGATVTKVKAYFVGKLGMSPVDAAEQALQIQGTTIWPDEDTHVGALTKGGVCSVAFNLMPKHRVHG